MMTRTEIIGWGYFIKVFDECRKNEDDFVAIATLHVYRDVGIVSGISSPRLFNAVLSGEFVVAMRQLGLRSLEGYMTDPMARALRMASRGKATFAVTKDGVFDGRHRQWVVLTPLVVPA